MSVIDAIILLILSTLIVVNLMLLKTVRIIFKTYPALYDYFILIALALMLLALSIMFLTALVLILL